MTYWMRKNHRKLKVLMFVTVFFFVLFSFSNGFAEKLAVNSSVANVRSGPGTSYEVMWQVEKYTPMLVVDKEETGKWYKIKDYEGDIGWISKDLLTKIDTVIAKPRDERCNIRSGPGTNNDVLFKAIKGVPFKVLERKGNWIHLQHVDGDKGWIHKNLVW
ncbi:MAG: SH3 domain-containing protein [Desulfobacterales bacterium]|nr:SH3 domain-containing protein [Desulfobacterales bacterium]